MAKSRKSSKATIDLSFPLGGIDVSQGFERQPVRQMASGGYARTTPSGINVRSFEPSTGRNRGGSRAGLSRYVNAIPGGSAGLIQDLNVVVGTGYNPPGGSSQTSQSGRVVSLVAVIGGTVYVCDAGGSSWTAAANDSGYTQQLNPSGVIRSAVNNQKLYYADGLRWAYYDPSLNQLRTWGASTGELPEDSSGNKPRLITTWRGRTVLSGLPGDPQNWFMSAVGDPTDFNYAPDSSSPTQAVAGNNSTLGLVGDVVTGLVPYTDDLLVYLCDSSVWQLSGDPMAGGSFDRVSDVLGGAFGNAWAKGPGGEIFFFTNRGSVALLLPGRQLTEISGPIERHLRDVNTGTHQIRMLWDSRQQALHVFVTATAAAASATHYCFEPRTGAWWMDQFASNAMNPLACCVFDGNESGDRAPLIGSWDGYVRAIDVDAGTDDGHPIASSVMIGPIMADEPDDVMLQELWAVLGSESGDVTCTLHAGQTVEEAIASPASGSVTFSAGRSTQQPVRRSGKAIFVKVSSTARWQLEKIIALTKPLGMARMR